MALHRYAHQDVAVLHRVYAESVRNLGTPVFSRRYFAMLTEAFGDCCDIVTVLDAGQPIASVLNFYFRDEVLPYYGGGTAAGPASGGKRLHVLGSDASCRRTGLPFVRLRPQQARHRRVCLQAQLGVRAGDAALPLSPRAWRRDPGPQPAQSRNTACSLRPGSVCRCRWPICSARRSCAGLVELTCAICCSCPIACPIRLTRATRSEPGTFSAISRARIACISVVSSMTRPTSRILIRCVRSVPIWRAFRSIPAVQRLKALLRLRPGQPLSLGYFQDRRLKRWVDAKLAGGMKSKMSSCFLPPWRATSCTRRATRRILDMVDVDSEKWTAYAETARFPARLVWAREGRTLLAFERLAAARFDHSHLRLGA